jgi:tetratricopeptide (TPR) repeat protein
MTPEQLEALWQAAQQHEEEGALDAARSAYLEILAGSPRQIMVQVKLSELEQRAGRYREARRHALEAGATISMTRRWEGLAFVTANMLVFDERELVRGLILQADWEDPRVLGQSLVLSQQLWLCGDPVAALRMLDLVARRGGKDYRLSYSRAMALQQLGQGEEATRAFEECIRMAPDFALAHWSLAYHAPSGVPGARLDRIRAALGRSQDRLEGAMLHYALYKELDDADERDAAWSELEKGAALMHSPFLPATRLSDALVEPTAAGAVEADREPDAAGRVPVFITGMPRTGTTLLSRIVSAHPAVADAGELAALEHALAQVMDRFVELPLKPEDASRVGGIRASEIAEAYMRRTSMYYGDGIRCVIDKSPNNVFAAGIIARAMPEAKILCLVRGPMDAGYSNLRQLFQNGAFPYSYDQRQLAERYALFQAVVAHWQERLPSNFLAVSYESLVEDPVAVGRAVFEFCGLEFDPAFVDITRNASPSATASASQIRSPIHQRGIGEWLRYERRLQPLADRLRELGVSP